MAKKKATTKSSSPDRKEPPASASQANREKLKAVCLRILEQYRRRHEEYSDPWRAWQAYKAARGSRALGVEIPDWVLTYFDRVVERLDAIANDLGAPNVRIRIDPAGVSEERPERSRRSIDNLVAAALEMTEPGRGTAFSRRRKRLYEGAGRW
jgi:hypothetical protein